MYSKIFCLFNGKCNLNNEHRDLLFHTARKIYQDGTCKQKVKTPSIEGSITTKRKMTFLGSIFGMEFSATFETEHGQETIGYIVRTGDLKQKDLDKAIWGTIPLSVFLEEALEKSTMN